jgi:DNA-binding transcriptional MerR regulator
VTGVGVTTQRIGDVARGLGLDPDTLRCYERGGLLHGTAAKTLQL